MWWPGRAQASKTGRPEVFCGSWRAIGLAHCRPRGDIEIYTRNSQGVLAFVHHADRLFLLGRLAAAEREADGDRAVLVDRDVRDVADEEVSRPLYLSTVSKVGMKGHGPKTIA